MICLVVLSLYLCAYVIAHLPRDICMAAAGRQRLTGSKPSDCCITGTHVWCGSSAAILLLTLTLTWTLMTPTLAPTLNLVS